MKMKQKRLLCMVGAVMCACMLHCNAAESPPNVLVILADDQGYHDLSCQGATDFQTPNIDRLATSGVRFTDGYVTAPQCLPSRCGLLTGVSQSRFGCFDNSSHKGLPSADLVQTLPEQLQARGYTTGVIGKWHIGMVENHVTLPGNHPWERGFAYVMIQADGHSHYFPYRKEGKKWMTDRGIEPRLMEKMEDEAKPRFLDNLPEDIYLTDYYSEQAAKFIKRNRENPWFLYLAYNAPHTPCVAKDDVLKKYSHIKDRKRAILAAMMDSVDEGVGNVLDALKETGQSRRTLIFYLSDNGAPTNENGSRNDPLSGKKGDVHEGGIRVPFIASWPGTIPAGQVLPGPVISLDILPTSLSAAGVQNIPEVHEGKNLLPWLHGDAPCPDNVIYWSWRNKSAIRYGDLKEARNMTDSLAADGSTVPAHMFSNIRENPSELPGQALQSQEQKQMLSKLLDDWLKKISDDQKRLISEE